MPTKRVPSPPDDELPLGVSPREQTTVCNGQNAGQLPAMSAGQEQDGREKTVTPQTSCVPKPPSESPSPATSPGLQASLTYREENQPASTSEDCKESTDSHLAHTPQPSSLHRVDNQPQDFQQRFLPQSAHSPQDIGYAQSQPVPTAHSTPGQILQGAPTFLPLQQQQAAPTVPPIPQLQQQAIPTFLPSPHVQQQHYLIHAPAVVAGHSPDHGLPLPSPQYWYQQNSQPFFEHFYSYPPNERSQQNFSNPYQLNENQPDQPNQYEPYQSTQPHPPYYPNQNQPYQPNQPQPHQVSPYQPNQPQPHQVSPYQPAQPHSYQPQQYRPNQNQSCQPNQPRLYQPNQIHPYQPNQVQPYQPDQYQLNQYPSNQNCPYWQYPAMTPTHNIHMLDPHLQTALCQDCTQTTIAVTLQPLQSGNAVASQQPLHDVQPSCPVPAELNRAQVREVFPHQPSMILQAQTSSQIPFSSDQLHYGVPAHITPGFIPSQSAPEAGTPPEICQYQGGAQPESLHTASRHLASYVPCKPEISPQVSIVPCQPEVSPQTPFVGLLQADKEKGWPGVPSTLNPQSQEFQPRRVQDTLVRPQQESTHSASEKHQPQPASQQQNTEPASLQHQLEPASQQQHNEPGSQFHTTAQHQPVQTFQKFSQANVRQPLQPVQKFLQLSTQPHLQGSKKYIATGQFPRPSPQLSDWHTSSRPSERTPRAPERSVQHHQFPFGSHSQRENPSRLPWTKARDVQQCESQTAHHPSLVSVTASDRPSTFLARNPTTSSARFSDTRRPVSSAAVSAGFVGVSRAGSSARGSPVCSATLSASGPTLRMSRPFRPSRPSAISARDLPVCSETLSAGGVRFVVDTGVPTPVSITNPTPMSTTDPATLSALNPTSPSAKPRAGVSAPLQGSSGASFRVSCTLPQGLVPRLQRYGARLLSDLSGPVRVPAVTFNEQKVEKRLERSDQGYQVLSSTQDGSCRGQEALTRVCRALEQLLRAEGELCLVLPDYKFKEAYLAKSSEWRWPKELPEGTFNVLLVGPRIGIIVIQSYCLDGQTNDGTVNKMARVNLNQLEKAETVIMALLGDLGLPEGSVIKVMALPNITLKSFQSSLESSTQKKLQASLGSQRGSEAGTGFLTLDLLPDIKTRHWPSRERRDQFAKWFRTLTNSATPLRTEQFHQIFARFTCGLAKPTAAWTAGKASTEIRTVAHALVECTRRYRAPVLTTQMETLMQHDIPVAVKSGCGTSRVSAEGEPGCGSGCVIVTGEPGCGSTFLLLVKARQALERGLVVAIFVPPIMTGLRQYYWQAEQLRHHAEWVYFWTGEAQAEEAVPFRMGFTSLNGRPASLEDIQKEGDGSLAIFDHAEEDAGMMQFAVKNAPGVFTSVWMALSGHSYVHELVSSLQGSFPQSNSHAKNVPQAAPLAENVHQSSSDAVNVPQSTSVTESLPQSTSSAENFSWSTLHAENIARAQTFHVEHLSKIIRLPTNIQALLRHGEENPTSNQASLGGCHDSDVSVCCALPTDGLDPVFIWHPRSASDSRNSLLECNICGAMLDKAMQEIGRVCRRTEAKDGDDNDDDDDDELGENQGNVPPPVQPDDVILFAEDDRVVDVIRDRLRDLHIWPGEEERSVEQCVRNIRDLPAFKGTEKAVVAYIGSLEAPLNELLRAVVSRVGEVMTLCQGRLIVACDLDLSEDDPAEQPPPYQLEMEQLVQAAKKSHSI